MIGDLAPTVAAGRILGSVDFAPAPHTLIDILADTASRYPDAIAIDDGVAPINYGDLFAAVADVAGGLVELGVRRGDRVGIRLPSGQRALYLAILGTLAAGAAYVPVDADDPVERANLVFAEAGVRLVIDAALPARSSAAHPPVQTVTPDDDAWVIFTSGSTGTPKGVAVTHRSAAAFVDAEARIFVQEAPIGPTDRVLAGLSVAFDASCEEMWLAWRHGACLVPAPGRWSAAGWISALGSSLNASRSCRLCRHSRRCGRRRRSTGFGW